MKNCNCNPCKKPCGKEPCACPKPYLGIEAVCLDGSDNVSVLRFDLDGIRSDYDFKPLIYNNQTDTSLTANVIERVLTFMAERHIDSISAEELGSLLHLSDIGDVTSAGAEDGSLLVYQKSTSCGDGCTGIHDQWRIWNALDNQVSSSTYVMTFDGDGKAQTLGRPQSPNHQYLLGWNKGSQLSYFKPKKAAAKPAQGGALYWDEANNEIVYVS